MAYEVDVKEVQNGQDDDGNWEDLSELPPTSDTIEEQPPGEESNNASVELTIEDLQSVEQQTLSEMKESVCRVELPSSEYTDQQYISESQEEPPSLQLSATEMEDTTEDDLAKLPLVQHVLKNFMRSSDEVESTSEKPSEQKSEHNYKLNATNSEMTQLIKALNKEFFLNSSEINKSFDADASETERSKQESITYKTTDDDLDTSAIGDYGDNVTKSTDNIEEIHLFEEISSDIVDYILRPEIFDNSPFRLKSGAQYNYSNPDESSGQLTMCNTKVNQLTHIITDIYFDKQRSTDLMSDDEPNLKSEENQEDTETLLGTTSLLPDSSRNSQSQLDENYRIIDHMDLTAKINVDWHRMPPKPNIESKLLSLLHDKTKCDVRIHIGDTKIRCHLCVLQHYSPYFNRSNLHDARIIRLPGQIVSAKAFNILYNSMLGETMNYQDELDSECLLQLHQTAKYLGLKEMVNRIWSILDVRESNAFRLLNDIAHMNVSAFDKIFFSRISLFFLTLVSSQEFVEMSQNYICCLLSSNNLGVNTEIEVFYAALRWLSHKWPERREAVPSLMQCIRFDLLTPIFLRFLHQTKHKTRVLHYISQCELVKDMINKAFFYVSAEMYCNDSDHRLPYQLPETDAPTHRKWIFDLMCPHHEEHISRKHHFFSYEQFLAYLEMLHETGPQHWQNLRYISCED